jgi:hypothetical protein
MSCVVEQLEPRTGLEEKRIITSTIHDVSVAEVRKCLALIRRRWDQRHIDPKAPPMYNCDPVGVQDLSVEDFALKFVVGHHARRTNKQKSMVSTH